MFVTSSLITSCSNSIEDSTNNLIGTEWKTSYADDIMVLKFISSNEVQGYFANSDGAYLSGETTGSYSLKDNVVYFSGITYQWIYAYYKLEKGYINGSLLKTEGVYTFNKENNNWYEWEETWANN